MLEGSPFAVAADTQGPSNRSVLLIALRSNPSGSKAPPIQVSISSCSGCLGLPMASRKWRYPGVPPTSSGGRGPRSGDTQWIEPLCVWFIDEF